MAKSVVVSFYASFHKACRCLITEREEVTRVSLAFDQTTLVEMLLCTRKAVFPPLKADDIVLSCYGVRGYSSSLAHDR